MPRFLLIDSCRLTCAVGISNQDIIIAHYGVNNNNHAEFITVGIEDCLKQSSVTLQELDAIVINGGPGSYTGLRIGLSVAKGLCYVLNKPLIMLDALRIIYRGMQKSTLADLYCVVLDNRRDELFYALYDANGATVVNTCLSIVNDDIFKNLAAGIYDGEERRIIFAGSGIKKLSTECPSIPFIEVAPDITHLLPEAQSLYQQQCFSDIAYSEPFYHKMVYINAKKG